MILIERGIFLKTILVAIYAEVLHHSFIPTIYENFKSVFFTYLMQTKIWKLVYRFDLST